ncbi:MAG: hypothetical protein GX495_08490 [Chloroflexi bacterium]|nr:hypothetical protein [Chloroflexota bacterium]
MILLHEQITGCREGFIRVRELEDDLSTQWGEKLPSEHDLQAQLHRYRMALWQKREDAIEQRHTLRLMDWEQNFVRPAAQAANLRFIAGLALLMLACLSCSIPFLVFPLPGERWQIYWIPAAALTLAGVAVLIWGIAFRKKADRMRLGAPPRPGPFHHPQLGSTSASPVEQPAPNPGLEHEWLQALDHKARTLYIEIPDRLEKPGIEALVQTLAGNLSSDHLGLRRILLGRGLETGLILLGPEGIWMLESVHWSGQVQWDGTNWNQETAGVQPPHVTWKQQEEALVSLLRSELTGLTFEWEQMVRGGLAFTHPGVNLQPDPAFPLDSDVPPGWLQRIQNSAPLPGFTLEVRLQVADALTRRSRSLRQAASPEHAEYPASRIAEEVYHRRLSALQARFGKVD